MKVITGQPVDLQPADCNCDRVNEIIHTDDSISVQIAGTPIGNNLTLNGGFTTNLDDWTDSGTSWAWDSMYAVGLGGSTLSQDMGIESGKSYRLQFYALVEFYDPTDPFRVDLGATTFVVYNDGWQDVIFTADSAHDVEFVSQVAYYARITGVSLYQLDTENINFNIFADSYPAIAVAGTSDAGHRLLTISMEDLITALDEPFDCFELCVEYFDPYVLQNNEFQDEEGWTVDEGSALSYEWGEGEVDFTCDQEVDLIPFTFSQPFEASEGCLVETWGTKYGDTSLSISATWTGGGSRVFDTTIRIKDALGNVIATRTYINFTLFTSGNIISPLLAFSPTPVVIPQDGTYTYELIVTLQSAGVETLTVTHKAIVMTCPRVLCSPTYKLITDKCDTVAFEFSDAIPKLNFRFPFTFFARFPASVKPFSGSFNRAQALLFSGRTVSSQTRAELKKVVRTGLINEHHFESMLNMLSLATVEMDNGENNNFVEIAYVENDLEVGVEDAVCQLKLEIPYMPQPQNKLSRNSDFS